MDRHELAWDAATGNGQAARGLAERFARVVATDRSVAQLGHAAPHPRIDFRVGPAEAVDLPRGSVDLATAAAAVHWFDLDAYFDEVRRVVRPGGVLAVWTYHVGDVEPPWDRFFHELYFEILKPYFAPETRLVDERYRTLPLPGEEIAAPTFCMEAEWTCRQLEDFVESWSGTAAYREATGRDPLDELRGELERLWGDPDTPRRIGWPLHLRAVRL